MGERALICVDAKYAYGSKGAHAYPAQACSLLNPTLCTLCLLQPDDQARQQQLSSHSSGCGHSSIAGHATSLVTGEHGWRPGHRDPASLAAGNFSFPSVPPDAALEYEAELVSFEPVDEARALTLIPAVLSYQPVYKGRAGCTCCSGPCPGLHMTSQRLAMLGHPASQPAWLTRCTQAAASSSMMYEDRLEAAHRRRLAGNQLFADAQHAQALAQYALAQDCLNEDFMMQVSLPPDKRPGPG